MRDSGGRAETVNLVPELPDVTIYLEALGRTIRGKTIEKIVLRSPFVLRSVEPDLFEAEGKAVHGFHRLGKRIVWELEADLYLVFHLMIAGRFHWKKPETKPRSKVDLIAFGFESGVLMMTEAGTKKRSSLHVVRGQEGLGVHERRGLEVLIADEASFRRVLLSDNHTLKRVLTDPQLFSGIGNAYSDEILHAAKLSPVRWTSRLTNEEISRLFRATQDTLQLWIQRLRDETGDRFPEKVTAFRAEMAAHGRFGKACPTCGAQIQRIVYAANETNYCPACQTAGKILADRSLSRILRDDWPRRVEELEG